MYLQFKKTLLTHNYSAHNTICNSHHTHSSGMMNYSAGLNLILRMQLGQGMACVQTSIPVSNATKRSFYTSLWDPLQGTSTTYVPYQFFQSADIIFQQILMYLQYNLRYKHTYIPLVFSILMCVAMPR